ncbi:Aste57867_10486 [Aphanomyces stellatus]|uniref:Aste57867_10486 protein n=1 Tax=Aphanomyces stellatus TaxID=120398 RepID=A0A485KRK8_9STRA|nr:hypothetical protein As57867_010446 [Aphanomyces stellatus]VFT87360.1 Aste57867_10486 [Aphanomyces stellatus]
MMEYESPYCLYAYKQCTNLRSRKKDGELHRLCEHHRNKANALQKVYATKRRDEKRALRLQRKQAAARLVPIEPHPTVPPLPEPPKEEDMEEEPTPWAGEKESELSEDEWEYLSRVL